MISLEGPTEIKNNSQIWMFYTKNMPIKINEKNRISTTHWLFNIDKRLILKDVLPEANRLLIKHREKSPHNHGGMNNYYSYLNTDTNQWTFYPFDSIKYKFKALKSFREYGKDTLLLKFDDLRESMKTLHTIDNLYVIQSAFSSQLSFQNYMEIKAALKKVVNKDKLSSIELIYSN